MAPTPPPSFRGLRSFPSAAWALAERAGAARAGRPRGCSLVRGLKSAILHRPAKVERTRKRSEGFTPDRKAEKKKGEGPAAPVAAQGLAA